MIATPPYTVVLAAKLRPGVLRRFTSTVALRVDFPAVLAFTAHRGTHFAHCVRAVRTTAMKMMTKRAARAAAKAVLLGVAEAHRSPPERSFAEVCLVIALNANVTNSLKAGLWHAGLKPYFNEGLSVFGAMKTSHATSSRQAVSGGGDFCGGEERNFGVGARSALRELTRCGCPNGEREANAVSSAARPQSEHRSGVDTKCDRHSMSPRPVPPAATRATALVTGTGTGTGSNQHDH